MTDSERSERQTRSRLMALFRRQGRHPRGDLGQSFLIDLNLLELIVREAELTRDDVALEIGAGTGGLTTFLAREAGAVVSVEYDAHMHRLASQAILPYNNVTLLHTDALKNKNRFAPAVLEAVQARLAEAPGRRLKLVANLPYHIATPVISNLVASDLPWERMVVTIQWEVAQRIIARPSSSDYGALSVWLQSQCHAEILRKLPPSVFWPRPQVDSAIVKLLPDPDRASRIHDRAFLQEFARQVFAHRRKVLRGGLSGLSRDLSKAEIEAMLREMNVPEDARAEQLDVETLVELANRVQEAMEVKG